MLQNEYLVAKIGVDTAENEPSKVWGARQPRVRLLRLEVEVPPRPLRGGRAPRACREHSRGFFCSPSFFKLTHVFT